MLGNGSLSVTASGGSGGNSADPGGAATASATGSANQIDVTLSVAAYAFGGTGGSAYGVGSTAGAGGNASATAAIAGFSANTTLSISASQVGGAGGSGYSGANGGTGADSTLTNALSDFPSGGPLLAQRLTLNQSAAGGSGGSSDTGTGGNGGNAYSSLTHVGDTAAASLVAVVQASAGSGGDSVLGTAGHSGTATASLALSSTTLANTLVQGTATAAGGRGTFGGDVNASATVAGLSSTYAIATANNSFATQPGVSTAVSSATSPFTAGASSTAKSYNATSGLGNIANATATSWSSGGVGVASAVSTGTGGAATAQSNEADSHRNTVVLTARAPTTTFGAAVNTRSAVGYGLLVTPPTTAPNATLALAGNFGSSSSAYATGAVSTVLGIDAAQSPTVRAAFANATSLADGVLGANYLAGTTGIQTYTAEAEYALNLTGSNHIELGLLNMTAYGAGFDELSFSVKDDATGKMVFSDTFMSLQAAAQFFHDDAVALYDVTGSADFTVSYQLTASNVEGAGISYIVGASPVPLPPAWILMVSGLAGLARRRVAPRS